MIDASEIRVEQELQQQEQQLVQLQRQEQQLVRLQQQEQQLELEQEQLRLLQHRCQQQCFRNHCKLEQLRSKLVR